MPKANYHLLCHFLCVLYHISRRCTHNLMSAANLGVCVGPSLLWSDSPATCPTEDLRTVPALVEMLITHCEFLCGPHVPNLLGDPRDSGTEESDCKYIIVFDQTTRIGRSVKGLTSGVSPYRCRVRSVSV